MRASFAITLLVLAAVVIASAQASPRNATRASGQAASVTGANAEMTRLAGMFAGDWDTTEHMEVSDEFPRGGDRIGRSQCGLDVLGLVLVCHGNSDGSAGRLSYMITIWLDKSANLYHFFTCFNESKDPCEVRGTAHWEDNQFVNEYEEEIDGKKVKAWDTFRQTSPTRRVLEYSRDSGNGKRTLMITSTSTRR